MGVLGGPTAALSQSLQNLFGVCCNLFLSAPLAGFNLASMLDADQSGALVNMVSARVAERGLERPLFNARFDVRVQSVFTIALGAAAIVFALILQLLFRRKNRPYGAHLIFALHISFIYLVTVAAGASRRIGVSVDESVIAGYLLLAPYLTLALKRVYPESIGMILLKASALFFLTLALNRLADLVVEVRVGLRIAVEQPAVGAEAHPVDGEALGGCVLSSRRSFEPGQADSKQRVLPAMGQLPRHRRIAFLGRIFLLERSLRAIHVQRLAQCRHKTFQTLPCSVGSIPMCSGIVPATVVIILCLVEYTATRQQRPTAHLGTSSIAGFVKVANAMLDQGLV